MRAAGLDVALLDDSNSSVAAAPAATMRATVDPRVVKFRRMLKMHVPRRAVEAKMRAQGLDVALLDGDASASVVTASAAPPAANAALLNAIQARSSAQHIACHAHARR